MKKKLILLVSLFAIMLSCKDDSLDPLQMNKVRKGTILALRGAELDNLYWGTVPVTQLDKLHLAAAPEVATGNETFNFDAEYLAEDPASLTSVEVYVIKNWSSQRILLTTIPSSQFKADGTYPKPWVSISLKFTDMIGALGLVNTIPLPQATQDSLLNGSYHGAIKIECDLNLTNGNKILAADILATGLFDSDQFYPAMKLSYPMYEFCAYGAATWAAAYVASQSDGNFYTTNLAADGSVTNRFHLDNFLNKSADVYFDMKPATTPFNQTITIPDGQSTSDGGVFSHDENADESTYDQCTENITLNCKYVKGGKTTRFSISLSKQ